MDTDSICSVCFLYHFTGDATIFDGHSESEEEGDKLMHHTQESLQDFIGEHEIVQQVIHSDGDAEPYFSNSKCDCCNSLPGMRHDVVRVTLYDPDDYEEAVFIESLSEIPTEIMQEVRNESA